MKQANNEKLAGSLLTFYVNFQSNKKGKFMLRRRLLMKPGEKKHKKRVKTRGAGRDGDKIYIQFRIIKFKQKNYQNPNRTAYKSDSA